MTFTLRIIQENETLGSLLKTMRRHLHLSLEEVSKKTKIQLIYLRALEQGSYEQLPESLYVRHFLKTYARILKTDASYLISHYENERKTCDFMGKLNLPLQKIKQKRLFLFHGMWKWMMVSIFTFGLLFYLGAQVIHLLQPPDLSILNPSDGMITKNATIFVQGKTQKETKIFVNTLPVLTDQNGFFSIEIILSHGTNIIAVEGSQRYSKSTTIYRRVILDTKAQDQITQLPPISLRP
jgi:transcriptional regulator with XRE-family HTH domain